MYLRSPIYYMGSKYKLLADIIPQLPTVDEVETFYDLFGGSGCVSLNVKYKKIIYNELNKHIYNLLKTYKEDEPNVIIDYVEKQMKKFGFVKEGTDKRNCKDKDFILQQQDIYIKYREWYNSQSNKNIYDLYLLSCFSYCNIIRFNNYGKFNMPFGKRGFIDENKYKIKQTHKLLNSKNLELHNENAFDILKSITKNEKQFIYLDPPYSNTTAIYNEQKANGGWTEKDDFKLFNELDRLNKLGIKWALSNVLENKGKSNNHILKWAKDNNYTIIEFYDQEYTSLGKGNSNTREVLIINYEQRIKQYTMFDFIN